MEAPTKKHFIGANIVGLFLIYAVAVPYLYVSLNFWLDVKASWSHILVIGFLNSIVADFCLSLLAALLAQRLYPVFQTARTLKIVRVEKEHI